MKLIKYTALTLCWAGSLFLLFNVFFGRKMDWSRELQSTLVDIAFASIGVSLILLVMKKWV